MRPANRWMWATLAATLALGVGLGIFVDRVVLERAVHSDSVDVSPRRHDDHVRPFREHLQQVLDLSPEQREALEVVLAKNHEIAREFWEASRRDFDTLRQQFRRDIRAVLTEEQTVRFDRMLAERDARRKQRK